MKFSKTGTKTFSNGIFWFSCFVWFFLFYVCFFLRFQKPIFVSLVVDCNENDCKLAMRSCEMCEREYVDEMMHRIETNNVLNLIMHIYSFVEFIVCLNMYDAKIFRSVAAISMCECDCMYLCK